MQESNAQSGIPAPPSEFPPGSRWVFLSREEAELIRIYRNLDIREAYKLIQHAFDLEQEKNALNKK